MPSPSDGDKETELVLQDISAQEFTTEGDSVAAERAAKAAEEGRGREDDERAAAEEEQELRASLTQPVMEGSCCFCTMCNVCCLLGCVVPIVLVAVGANSSSTTLGLVLPIAAGVLFVVALVWCCVSVSPVFRRQPPVPERSFPLVNVSTVVKPRRVCVLVNPMGGLKGATGVFQKYVKPKLEAAGVEVKKINTEYAGHARVLCKTLPLDTFDAIVAIGGDGTFHECVNGMLSREDGATCPIGVVPAGSGNSFMTDFGLQNDPGAAVDNIAAGRLARIDAVKVVYGPDEKKHRVWSINVAAYSVDHCMGSLNIDGYRSCLGTKRYDICSLWGLLKGRAAAAKIYVDRKLWADGVSSVFVNCTQHFGKGMRAMPGARLDDGKFDVGNVVGTRGEVLRLLLLIKTGQSAAILEEGGHLCQGQEVEMRLPQDQGLINVDGEVYVHRHNTVKMTLEPARLQIYAPPDASK